MKYFVRYIISFLMVFTITGCQDEFMAGNVIGEGKAKVSATLDFKPMSSALTRSSGTALKDINSLHVLLYDKDKQLIKSWKIDNYSTSDEPRQDADAENGKLAETTTKQATFELPEAVEYGTYYMYAVANISDLLTNAAYTENIKTVEGLKSISLVWNTENITANGQMMGYFTNTSTQSEDESLVLNEKYVNLHAWLRRAASKVTVAFNASKLKDGIRIYLKSLKIKHIPKTCYLGSKNTPGYTSDTFKERNNKALADELHEDGEIYYYSGDSENNSFTSWPFVSLGKPLYGLLPAGDKESKSPTIDDFHTENTPALYFYENLQGDAKSRPDIKDKRQDATGSDGKGDPDGELDAPGFPGDDTYRLKDGVEFGTYIEVEGYYDARLSDHPGEGKIIYRFMLGKDIYKDYNAARNIHYKLTLVFNNYANDADWHIEYEDDKELSVPNPYYISYLYNQEARLPVHFKGSDLSNTKLKVEIIENHWWPTIERADDPYRFADLTKVYNTGNVSCQDAVWNGFLSLAKNDNKIIAPEDGGALFLSDKDRNKTEWRELDEKRIFNDLTVGTHGDYTVELDERNGGYNLYMPFFTRPKQLVPSTGYTGNNPYVAYTREAKLRLSLLDKNTDKVLKDADGKDLIENISINQVRRCVNPKGVWRSWDKNESFHVVMKILPYDSATKFETYDSKGPWRATIEVDDDNMIKLREAGDDGYVRGSIDTPMDFHIDFNGTCSDASEVRCAIVLVEYNNYTCHHRIFVRQGYAPLVLNSEKIKWHTFNLYSANEETLSPLEEGSLFKYGNLDDAILAENNKIYGFQKQVGENKLALANNTSKKWSEITTASDKTVGSDGFSTKVISVKDVTNPSGANVSVRVASVEDYDNLRNAADREFGYGVLYGDGATETLDNVDEVYGYYRDGNKTFGMRGCFVYNKKNGKNLFFPIGASGYGRRKTDQSWYKSGLGYPGALQYAWRSKRYSEYDWQNGWRTLTYRPLFEDIYMRPGAIYWCDKFKAVTYTDAEGTKTSQNKSFLDVNYFTFDFNTGGNEPLEGKNSSSACFIRCVEDIK